MIVVDTSVWVDYFNGTQTPQTDILDDMLGQQVIVIGDLIYTEVLQGFNADSDFQKTRQLLDTLVFREMVGREIALKSARTAGSEVNIMRGGICSGCPAQSCGSTNIGCAISRAWIARLAGRITATTGTFGRAVTCRGVARISS